VKTIWKFNLNAAGQLEQGDGCLISRIEFPRSAQILSVDVQHGDVVLWAAVTPEDDARVPRRFAIVPTGGTIPNGGLSPRFLGTVLMENGTYVWHVFAL
jgi:hypothetical protein